MRGVPVLYQETRLSLSPSSPTHILHINTTPNASSSSIISFGAGRKRSFDEISGLDEESYARKYLATEGSLFFRPKSKAPRNFLWRVLDDHQLLEVQCVDLVLDRDHTKDESWLTFHITSPAKIIPGGVALADSQEKDALDIFVLTTGNELYTITLRRDLLVRQKLPAAFDSATCVKKASPSSFTYKSPYRLVAVSSLELLVSLHDGSILRLTREKGEAGTQWRETHFSEGGWSGTLKRSFALPIIKQRTVRYGNVDLFQDAIAAIAKSPDGKYVWTVGLDHTLKAWSIETGKVVVETDLVGDKWEHEDRKKQERFVMSPEQAGLLQIVSLPGIKPSGSADYFVVVHSPKDHQFKFYGVKTTFSSIDGESLRYEDVQSGTMLIPPIDDLMNTNIWHMEQFRVNPGPSWRESQLWLRIRSGATCRIFTLGFDLLDDHRGYSDLTETFKHGWSIVDSSSHSTDQLRNSLDFGKLDLSVKSEATLSEKWTEFLFYPGRFSEASLECALYMYRKGRSLPSASAERLRTTEDPLKEHITNAIAAKIILARSPNDQPDYDRYQADIHSQWTSFFSLLSHIHNRRHDTVGMEFDIEEGLPWTICADFVAPIRMSSAFERWSLNAELVISEKVSDANEDLQARMFAPETIDDDAELSAEENRGTSRLMFVARQLRRSFSPASQEMLRRTAVLKALDQSEQLPADESLQSLYEQCNLQDEIRDEEYNAVNDAAESLGGLGEINADQFLAVLECIDAEPQAHGTDHGEQAARYGQQMTISIQQEIVQQGQAAILDLLALLVFMRCDLEQDQLSPELQPGEVYEAIMQRLKQTELRLWLLTNVRYESEAVHGHPSQLRTIYECIFAQDWQAKPDRDNVRYQMPEMLTAWSIRALLGLNVEKWDGVTEYVFVNLLSHNELDLATDFLIFLSESLWHSYLKGRFHLLTGEYALASVAFKTQANELAQFRGRTFPALLSPDEQNSFGRGELFYFQHVSSLFEKLKVFSYTADFASLALASVNDREIDRGLREIDRRKVHSDSPFRERIGDVMDEIAIVRTKGAQSDLFNRLFNARVQTGQFELAFDVLKFVDDLAVQKSNLQQLLHTCVKRDAISTLLELPFEGDSVAEADAILLSLAKKSMAAGLPSGPQYHQILFAFRAQNSDFRGAAAILYEHMEHLRKTNRLAVQDPEDDTLVRLYVLLINTLACCSEKEAWLLADPIPGIHDLERKRKLVTLEDIRREYTAELDRRSDLMQGRFPVQGDEMDVLY